MFISGYWPGLYQPPLRLPLRWYLCLLVGIGQDYINLRFGFLFVDICVYWWGLVRIISTSTSASSSLIFVFIGGDWPGLYQPPLRFPLCWYLCLLVENGYFFYQPPLRLPLRWYLCLLVGIGRGYINLRFGFLFVDICAYWWRMAVSFINLRFGFLFVDICVYWWGFSWNYISLRSDSSSLIFVFISGDWPGLYQPPLRFPLCWYLCLLVENGCFFYQPPLPLRSYLCLLVGIGRGYINLRFGFLFVDSCVYWWGMAVYFDQPPLRLPLRWYLCLLVGIGRDYINLRFGFLFVDICVYWWRMADADVIQPPLRLPLRWDLCLLVGI